MYSLRHVKEAVGLSVIAAYRSLVELTLRCVWRTLHAVWMKPLLLLTLQCTPRVAIGGVYKNVEEAVIVNRVQELCESRGGRPGLSVLMSLTVSVDVKQH